MRINDIEIDYDGLNPSVVLRDRSDDTRMMVRSPEAVLALAIVLKRYGEQMIAVEAEYRRRSG